MLTDADGRCGRRRTGRTIRRPRVTKSGSAPSWPRQKSRIADAALAWVSGFTGTQQALKRLDQPAAERALGGLRGTLAEHLSSDGVWFDSSAWIVTAHRHPAGAS
jgi:hypothetical protein